MPTYNPNDFSPSSGKEINSQGNVVTPADGVNADGSQTVEDKPIAPILIDTIPFSSFTASAAFFKTYSNKLNRNAKKRLFMVKSSLDQPISSSWIIILDSTVYVGGSVGGDSYTCPTGKPAAGSTAYYSAPLNQALASPGDSFGISLSMGATAPTTGNILIYVTEIL